MIRKDRVANLRLAAVAVTAGVLAAAVGPADAQSIGFGASPGRASWRPSYQWNNGPYYTASHWNPYAPHNSLTNGLIYNEPSAPPYSTEPRGFYGPFTPGRGALGPYDEGYSAYSGYGDWYLAATGFVPTEEDYARSKVLFLRSGAPDVDTVGPDLYAVPAVAVNVATAPPPAVVAPPAPRPAEPPAAPVPPAPAPAVAPNPGAAAVIRPGAGPRAPAAVVNRTVPIYRPGPFGAF